MEMLGELPSWSFLDADAGYDLSKDLYLNGRKKTANADLLQVLRPKSDIKMDAPSKTNHGSGVLCAVLATLDHVRHITKMMT